MKKLLPLIIIIIVLIAVVTGGSFAYTHLAKKGDAQNLITNGETVENDVMNESDTSTSDNAADNDSEASEPNNSTPDFTVQDSEGNAVKLSDFVGKPVILNFWASWCGPCQSEMPDFEEAYAEYGDDIHFVMINVTDGSRETVDSAKKFINQAGYSFPIYFDTNLEASMKFGAYSIPTTYFIDADGNAVAQAAGAISKDIIQQGIDMIYEE